MVEVFVARNTSIRNIRYAQAALHNNWQRSKQDHQLIHRLGCLPMNRYSDMMANNSFRIALSSQNSAEIIFGQYEQVPFCFMHFQGDGVKGLLKVFAKILLMVVLNTTYEFNNAIQDVHQHLRHSHHSHHVLNPSPCLSQLMNEPLLMIRRRSKDIYLFTVNQNQPILRRIANFNSFIALNFTLKQVVHNVPPEVLQMFPLGSEINCHC